MPTTFCHCLIYKDIFKTLGHSDIICSNDSIYCMHYKPNFKIMWLKRKTRISCHFLAFFLLFTAPELKIYVSYVYETIRDYRGSICLCIFQISDLYLVFLVSHMISKLGPYHESRKRKCNGYNE